MSSKYQLIIEQKNTTWKIEIKDNDGTLLTKRGQVRKKVENFCEKIVKEKTDTWDVLICKDMVAFKNSCERKTYIYNKDYWNSRMRESFKKLDTRTIY